jgi:tRNA (guanine-N7-)-methyltransferase
MEWDTKTLALEPEQYPLLTSDILFKSDTPLEVEIGPGTGEYLCRLAAEHPERRYLGIEASRRSIYYAVNLSEAKGLTNVRWLRANVKLLYPRFPEAAWTAIYLHFPDPAHKPKDEKHIVFDQEFLDAAYRALRPGGQISVVSDQADFFMVMLERAETDGRFAKAHEGRFLAGFEPLAKSRFQRFWEGKGVEPKQFVLSKTG